MHISFVCPTLVKKSKFLFYRVLSPIERQNILICLLSFSAKRVRKSLGSVRGCRICCCKDDSSSSNKEEGYQYLESVFGIRQSYLAKKQKAPKYDPRVFWENFSDDEKEPDKEKQFVKKKREKFRSVRTSVTSNPTNMSTKSWQMNCWHKATRQPQEDEEPKKSYLSSCPLAQLIDWKLSPTLALAYLEKPCSESDIRTLLDVVNRISSVKVTPILKPIDSAISIGFENLFGKENCYLDTQGCFFSRTSPQNCCLLLTCDDSDATRASGWIEQAVQCLQEPIWKVYLYSSQQLCQCFCDTCRDLADSSSNRTDNSIVKSSTSSAETPERDEFLQTAKHQNVKEDKARIVVNHSTHIPGLIKVLEVLSQESCIQTIVPGRLRNGKSRSPRLLLRVTTTTPTGFKLLARKGTTVQEVFLVTAAEREFIEQVISRINKMSA
jgi:hypothetical protein